MLEEFTYCTLKVLPAIQRMYGSILLNSRYLIINKILNVFRKYIYVLFQCTMISKIPVTSKGADCAKRIACVIYLYAMWNPPTTN